MSAPPRVSIIIINKNDRGVVGTIESLHRERAASAITAEVIVVDASGGSLDDVRDRFTWVRWIPYVPPAGRRTIPHQRNVGIRAATGEVIVFIDASCVAQPGWLETLLAPILEEGEAIVAGGHRSTGAFTLRDEAVARLEGKRYVDEAPTINLALTRAVFERVGAFDESFDYGSDVDFTWRAADAGLRIRSVGDAIVTHDWGNARDEVRRSYLYGQARFRLHRKHRRWGMLVGQDVQVLVYPIVLVLAPLAIWRPRLVAVLGVPLWRNRRHRPLLTLIDHLVYGAGVLKAALSDLRAFAGRLPHR
jgi:GT2 family glycosyltransferase